MKTYYNNKQPMTFSWRPLAKANTIAAAAPVLHCISIFTMTYKPSKLGQTNLVYGYDQSSLGLILSACRITTTLNGYVLNYPG